MSNARSNDGFTNHWQVERYAMARGRRELEVALFSGWMNPHSEQLTREWLALADARENARRNLMVWGAGGLGAALLALLLAWLL